jgi:bifunctional DNA-binding transcriptional regulator/antitoxin component of YhaV-PrlF toxin-antitoxin module
MKILKEKSREYKGREYFKFKVNIPEMILKRSGLNAGDELEINTQEDTIILKKAKDS